MARMQAGTRVRIDSGTIDAVLGTVTDTEDKFGYVLVELDNGDIPTEFHVHDLIVWEGMECLELAWAAYAKIASVGDHSMISRQTPDWEAPKNPYDFAALTVRSLIPHTYNFAGAAHQDEATDAIYTILVEAFELLQFGHPAIVEIINELGGN